MKKFAKLLAGNSLQGKRVLIRSDFNVPLAAGHISSDARLRAGLPVIQMALAAGAKVRLMSHLGRPRAGRGNAENKAFSLAPVATCLGQLLGREIILVQRLEELASLEDQPLVMLENIRFLEGETRGDRGLAQRLAAYADVFVMDAFATAHRAHASTSVIAEYVPVACAGPLLVRELEALGRVMSGIEHPSVAVVGGAKISTKLPLLRTLSERVDHLLVGGGIANTFLAAAGFSVGKSLCETDLLEEARSIAAAVDVPLATDVVAACGSQVAIRQVAEVTAEDAIMDIGPATAQRMAAIVAAASTLIWNGPLGVFEQPQFAAGTARLAQAIATCKGYTVAGGGDTVAAAEQFGISDKISYLSTAGGAFLKYLEAGTLPAVEALEAADCSRS